MKVDLFEAFDEDYDPLAVDDDDIDQEEMDDDNPYDTVDYPTVRNMPEGRNRPAVYTPENFGSVQKAVAELLDHNPQRRLPLLKILDICRNGCKSSVVTEAIDEMQKDNYSVYTPTMFCRMLERAGALELEMPEVSTEHEDVEEGVEYLEIKERIDPIWRTTEEGLASYEEFSGDAVFRNIVLDRDSLYMEVYLAVMEFLNEGPHSKKEIEELTDTFEVTKNPRRFGGHFIDMLERADAIEWKDRKWNLSELGASLLPTLREAVAKAQEEEE
jgi:hypothetical protein